MRSAKAIWDDLKVRCAQSNVPKLFSLRKEISHLSQGTLTISAYFTKFKTIHDELQCLTSTPRCTCNHCTGTINAKLDSHEQSIQLTQFLMGRNDHFTGIREQILLMSPLPTLSQCYAMLLQDENQRGVSDSSHFSKESTAMNIKAKSQSYKGFKKNSSVTPVYCE